MSLNFSGPGRYPILTVCVLEPSAGPENFGILAPNRSGAVHRFHRDGDEGAFGDRQAVD